MKTTVIYHSADYDGIFCREIARKFLPDAELIGWNFGDNPLEIPTSSLYVMDLPIDKVFGFDYGQLRKDQPAGVPFTGPQHPTGLVWIDNHKSSIESHPSDIQGYRIDGVAACRLAWQWFIHPVKAPIRAPDGTPLLPAKEEFIARKVDEPL